MGFVSPLLSIIIPTYNSSELLKKALGSLKDFNPDLFEVIIVDDNSNPENRGILQSLVSNYDFEIRLFENEGNKGPGYSRNAGISNAGGKYITFLDSDDSFEDNFLDIVKPALEEDVDCILFDYHDISGSGERAHRSIFFADNRKEDKNEVLVFSKGSTWGKIYKRSIISDNTIFFLNQYRNEDLPFTKTAVSYCNTFKYYDIPLYNYYSNPDSLMHTGRHADFNNAIRASKRIVSNIKDRYEEECVAIIILEYLYAVGLHSSIVLDRKTWNSVVNEAKKLIPSLDNKYFERYPERVKAVSRLVWNKKYFLVRLLCSLKTRIRKDVK